MKVLSDIWASDQKKNFAIVDWTPKKEKQTLFENQPKKVSFFIVEKEDNFRVIYKHCAKESGTYIANEHDKEK